MALKRKGIVFTPGDYKYTDGVERKVWDDLVEMAGLPLVYPVTVGHPVDGIPSREDVVGTMSLKALPNEKIQGDLWILDEKEKDIPPEILEKIVNYIPTGISPGYKYDKLIEENAQLGILPNHFALTREDEDPRCPLGECGINVRLDSTYKYDQIFELEFIRPDTIREDSTEDAPKESEEAPTEEVTEVTPEEEPVSEEAEPETEPPAEQKPEVQEEVPEEEVVQEREPEVVIPPSVEVKNDLVIGDDGCYEYVPKAYKTEK